jgi:hypothetical protein
MKFTLKKLKVWALLPHWLTKRRWNVKRVINKKIIKIFPSSLDHATKEKELRAVSNSSLCMETTVRLYSPYFRHSLRFLPPSREIYHDCRTNRRHWFDSHEKIKIMLGIDPRSPGQVPSACCVSNTWSHILKEACCGDGNGCVSRRITILHLRVLLPEFQLDDPEE